VNLSQYQEKTIQRKLCRAVLQAMQLRLRPVLNVKTWMIRAFMRIHYSQLALKTRRLFIKQTLHLVLTHQVLHQASTSISRAQLSRLTIEAHRTMTHFSR